MNIAIILAGGCGQRMGSDIPKQFIEVNGKPIIVYTLDVFEMHPLIDAIIVVSLESWMDRTKAMMKSYNINKVVRVVEGGDNVQKSTLNGLCAAKEWLEDFNQKEGMANVDDSIILIHDSVRPMINEELITRNIENTRRYGNSITVAPPTDTYVIEEKGEHRLFPREQVHIVRAPQVFFLSEIMKLHERAIADGKQGYSDCCSMMCDYGIPFHETMGENINIKITYPEDIKIFRRLKG